MKEYICRKNDERIYQPKIHKDRIRELYLISQEIKLPMTVILDRIIREAIAEYETEKDSLVQ